MKLRDKTSWVSPIDGPWPTIDVQGQLERAEAEWLHTNGTGAYAMSTVALMHTRRYHGLLVAAINPPVDRHVALSHAETTLHVGERHYRLSTHQFPEVAPTPGYRFLETFAQDPLPRWVFRAGKGTLERTLALVRGHNAVVLGFTWSGKRCAGLTVRPLLPFRSVGELMHEHGGMMQRVTLRSGVVEIQPVPKLPPLLFSHPGIFMGSPDWWRRFEYLEDRGRFRDFQEDLWSPGTFEIQLEPGKTEYILVSLGDLPPGDPGHLTMQAAEHILAQDPGADQDGLMRALCVSADQFVIDVPGRETIMAGYPWLDVWTRDVAISVPGLLIARGRIDLAKRVTRTLLGAMHSGMLPQRLCFDGSRSEGLAPDATLLLFEVARQLLPRLAPDDPFIAEELFPSLRRVFVRVGASRRRWMWLTEDGLVANGAEGAALTWMDARAGSKLFTPRQGLAVELQALWTRGCNTLAKLASTLGDEPTKLAAQNARARAIDSFRARFWCTQTRYPFDCISEHTGADDAWADPTIRPNALIAAAIDPHLFDPEQQRSIIRRVKDELLTDKGVRTLSPEHSDYQGHFPSVPEEVDGAFHQGTVWPYLVGVYARVLSVNNPSSEDARAITRLVESCATQNPVLGHVPQVADGDEPNRPRGCPAQAFSVGELIRALELFAR